MNGEDYLSRLRASLKGLPAGQQDDLVAEIAAHLAEANEANPGQPETEMGSSEELGRRPETQMGSPEQLGRRPETQMGSPEQLGRRPETQMGSPEQLGRRPETQMGSPEQLGRRPETQMGSPEELGRRLKHIHRPNRWLDYLLVVGPSLVLFPLLTFLVSRLVLPTGAGPAESEPFYYWSIRLSLLLNAALIGFGLKRWQERGALSTSSGVLLYWLSSAWWVVFALCFREKRWQAGSYFNASLTGLVESIFWTLALVGLGLWLVTLLIRSRDPLLATLALLPCTVAIANLAVGQVIQANGFLSEFTYPNWRILYWGPTQISEVLWPALFFLFPQRPIRWLGLLTNAVPLTLINIVAAQRYPHLVALWSLPILLVLAGSLVDWLNHRRHMLEVR